MKSSHPIKCCLNFILNVYLFDLNIIRVQIFWKAKSGVLLQKGLKNNV